MNDKEYKAAQRRQKIRNQVMESERDGQLARVEKLFSDEDSLSPSKEEQLVEIIEQTYWLAIDTGMRIGRGEL